MHSSRVIANMTEATLKVGGWSRKSSWLSTCCFGLLLRNFWLDRRCDLSSSHHILSISFYFFLLYISSLFCLRSVRLNLPRYSACSSGPVPRTDETTVPHASETPTTLKLNLRAPRSQESHQPLGLLFTQHSLERPSSWDAVAIVNHPDLFQPLWPSS